MLSGHGSVMLHSAAYSFYDILILSYLLLASVFWIAPDFLIFTCLVVQLVAFHSSHVFLFSVFLCLLPSVCIFLSPLSVFLSLCPSQSFPLCNTKYPPHPPTQILLQSTDSTGLAHCLPPTPVWRPLPLPPLPPPLPVRRKRWGLLGTRPSSPPSSPPRLPLPFPQSKQESPPRADRSVRSPCLLPQQPATCIISSNSSTKTSYSHLNMAPGLPPICSKCMPSHSRPPPLLLLQCACP